MPNKCDEAAIGESGVRPFSTFRLERTPLNPHGRHGLRVPRSRATIRERAAQTALDMLRRHLLGLPVDPALE